MRKNIIITGGGMGNKGAQSMTFICVDELKKRYPEDHIVLITLARNDYSKYNFGIQPISYPALKNLIVPVSKIRAFFKRIKKQEIEKIDNLFNNARFLVDISGYALGSNWPEATVDYYLSCIECARKYNVPAYIMPQSFGPFEYAANSELMKRIKDTMAYPNVVFTREEEGYLMLKEIFQLKNLQKSCDMVLKSKEVNPQAIYKDYKHKKKPIILSNAVAIIPNIRNFGHKDKQIIMSYYKIMIDWLVSNRKMVYILHHSSEDSPICEEIKDLFANEDSVILIREDFDCFEYEDIVKQFDYLIASRYHSIIHALKNDIPCIAMGWATKYVDLLSLFEQKDCILDVRTNITDEQIIMVLMHMEENFKERRQIIKENLCAIQTDNLFDKIVAMEA